MGPFALLIGRRPSLVVYIIPIMPTPHRPMKIGIPKETVGGEHRVAAVPETVAKLKGAGFTVQVETGAGADSQVSDQAYEQAGAAVVAGAGRVLSDFDIVLKVQPPSATEAARLKEGAILVSFLQPAASAAVVEE